jgi:hypothetical protein
LIFPESASYRQPELRSFCQYSAVPGSNGTPFRATPKLIPRRIGTGRFAATGFIGTR